MLQASFLKSAASWRQCPEDEGAEVAFAGRSNSGKSSSINAILNRRGLARSSKSPGRTQMLQFFAVGEQRRIVDLPGYGYAAAPLRVRRQWEGMMGDYFRRRGSLRGVFVVVDARRGVGELDLRMLHVCAASEAPVHLLMNKCDRLKRGALAETLRDAERLLAGNGTVQEFSALRSVGVEEARGVLETWLDA
ncbi:MAG: ribosome biogenesis GTP-binding protein YihA/YsxC [Gammaproteobacteria bacterium]|nr:ribosome biogenesis GTP-binding protein YihA/YsxC [Gammaproteobacteria bacterium]